MRWSEASFVIGVLLISVIVFIIVTYIRLNYHCVQSSKFERNTENVIVGTEEGKKKIDADLHCE